METVEPGDDAGMVTLEDLFANWNRADCIWGRMR